MNLLSSIPRGGSFPNEVYIMVGYGMAWLGRARSGGAWRGLAGLGRVRRGKGSLNLQSRKRHHEHHTTTPDAVRI